MFKRHAGEVVDDAVAEAEAAEFLAPISECRVSAGAAGSIRARMIGALTATTHAGAPRSRWAAASLAVFAPLMAVSAVAAATGESPVSGPVDLVQSAAASVGIGGNSGDVRQDVDNRAGQSSDAGQPGSTPGNTANAPGLNQAAVAATETPTPGGTPAAGAAPDATATKTPPHENGKGCDDVLFKNGEPPFASPGGPVGCDVGNSGEHRKNGAKATPTPDAAGTPAVGETPAANGDVSDTSEDGNGGVSHGLGNGHSEDKPGNGQANGHDKHEHDPNANGNGPQTSGGGSAGSATPTPEPVAPTSSDSGSSGPGNSGGKSNGNGNGNGKNK